jgi:hypothetical protein
VTSKNQREFTSRKFLFHSYWKFYTAIGKAIGTGRIPASVTPVTKRPSKPAKYASAVPEASAYHSGIETSRTNSKLITESLVVLHVVFHMRYPTARLVGVKEAQCV